MFEIILVLAAIGFFLRAGTRRWRGAGADSLTTVLASAEAAAIITTTQREQILAHAAEHGAARFRLEGAAWLGIFAGLFVVAGVSLLIARNWEDIGAGVRVAAFLAALLAVGEGAIRTRERTLGVSLPFELLWLFLPLLGIGLYGQTFQLSGDTIRPFLVWLALTTPLAWLSSRPIVATLHTFAMVSVLFTGNFVVESFLSAVRAGRPSGMLALTGTGVGPSAWLLSFVMLGAITMQSLRLLPRAHRHHFVGVWALWLFGLLLVKTPLRIEHEGWLALAAVALSTLWIVVLAVMDTSLEERATATLVWLGTFYGLTFAWHAHTPAHGTATLAGTVVVVLAWIAAVGGALALPPARMSPLPGWSLAAKIVLLAPALVALLYLGTDVRLVWLASILMNGVLVAVAVGLMWHGSLVRGARQINLGVLVLVGVLITRFLDVFGSMLTSGIGFIVAGVLLAALSWALERTRRRLIDRPREAMS